MPIRNLPPALPLTERRKAADPSLPLSRDGSAIQPDIVKCRRNPSAEDRKRHRALRLRVSKAVNFDQPREPFPLRYMPPRRKAEPLSVYVARVEHLLFDQPRAAWELGELLLDMRPRISR